MPVLWGRWSLGLPGAVGVTPRAVPTWVPAHVWGTLLVTPPTHSVPTASIRGTMRSGRARALGWLPLPLLLLLHTRQQTERTRSPSTAAHASYILLLLIPFLFASKYALLVSTKLLRQYALNLELLLLLLLSAAVFTCR